MKNFLLTVLAALTFAGLVIVMAITLAGIVSGHVPTRVVGEAIERTPMPVPAVTASGQWSMHATDAQGQRPVVICGRGQTLNDAGDGCEPLPRPWWELLPACSTDSFIDTDTHPCLWGARERGNGQGDVVVIYRDETSLVIKEES